MQTEMQTQTLSAVKAELSLQYRHYVVQQLQQADTRFGNPLCTMSETCMRPTSDNIERVNCDGCYLWFHYLRAVGRKVLWSSACVCLSVCLCALFLSARYLKNRFMDHHQIWWVGAGGEPLEQVQFWC